MYITVMCPDILFIIYLLFFNDDSNYSNSIDYSIINYVK